MSRTEIRGRRKLDVGTTDDYEIPIRGRRIASDWARLVVITISIIIWILSTLASACSIIAVGAPESIDRPAAAVLMVMFTVGLTHRSGGRMRVWPVLAAVLAIAAVTTQVNGLIAAAAATTGILGAVLAVLNTKPAKTIAGVLVEYLLALITALSATLGVAAWDAPVDYQRFNLIVVGIALALAITLVWNLGAGLHGVGKQGLLIPIGFAVLLVVLLAYSSFVRSHGSETVVDAISDTVIWMRAHFHGVPRPVEVLIGFPALVVGVSIRSKHREGWWVLVFAVIGTAVLSTSLVTPGALPTYIALSTLYSSVFGLIVGLIVRHFVMRERSSRASRAIEDVVRVEPPRSAPLK